MGVPNCPPRFDTPKLEPFFQAVAEGDLRLPCCAECGNWQWYPFEVPACHPEAGMVWRSVPKTGTVFTYTTVHRCFLPGDQQDVAPYVSALVEPDGMPGIRLVTILVNLEGPAEIGMPVRLAPVQAGPVTLPAFEPLS